MRADIVMASAKQCPASIRLVKASHSSKQRSTLFCMSATQMAQAAVCPSAPSAPAVPTCAVGRAALLQHLPHFGLVALASRPQKLGCPALRYSK